MNTITPLETKKLLQYAMDSASWFLKSNSKNSYIDYLDGYSSEDVAMEALVTILKSKVNPKSKSYVTQVVLSVVADLSRKGKLPRLSRDSEISQETVIPLLTTDEVLSELREALDAEDLHLFIAAYESNLTIHDIAVLQGVSDRTIKRRLVELSSTINTFLVNPR